jgi:enoyl-CoA hydratase
MPQPAARLFELGLVNRICPPGEALATALALAEQIAGNAPLAVIAAKQVVTLSPDGTEAKAWALQQPILENLRKTADYREGIAAFAAKKQPQWQGK